MSSGIDVEEVAWLDRSDVVHRPYQVSSQHDLDVLQELGDRIVISHLDLIAYSNPGYFPDFERWEAYRQITRRALALADRIVFISREAAADASAQRSRRRRAGKRGLPWN